MDKDQLIEALKELFADGTIEVIQYRQNGIRVVIDGEVVQED